MTPEAEAVRNAYRLRRQMMQPKWTGHDPRWRVCWQKTADFVVKNELDLDQYVDAQFELKAPFPMPNQLYSPEALTRYKTFLGGRTDPLIEIVRRLEVEMNFLETRLGVGFDLEEVLSFPSSPLTPLFCYCVAVNFGSGTLAKIFEGSAKRQLARVPAAREVYRSLLSEGSNADG